MRIAIQGYEGSFHQEAAKKYYGNEVTIIPCATFRELVNIASDPTKSDGGLMAIENSIAGSILPNYNLLNNSNLQITGEIYIQIRQQLMVNKNVTISQITEVQSHNMALLECETFLDQYDWKLVESTDTALSAKFIKENNKSTIAAIASEIAAEHYDLEIIAKDIQTLKNNYTRFLALNTQVEESTILNGNKASIIFSVSHQIGSLAKVLSTIAEADINLSKLQSFPISGSEFEYHFIADLEFTDMVILQKVIQKLKSHTEYIKINGIYKKGLWNQQKD